MRNLYLNNKRLWILAAAVPWVLIPYVLKNEKMLNDGTALIIMVFLFLFQLFGLGLNFKYGDK